MEGSTASITRPTRVVVVATSMQGTAHGSSRTRGMDFVHSTMHVGRESEAVDAVGTVTDATAIVHGSSRSVPHFFTSFVRLSVFFLYVYIFSLLVHLQQQQQRQRGGMRNERGRDGQDRGRLPNGRNVDRDRFGRPLERDRFRERGEGQGRDRTVRSFAPNAKTPPPVVTSRPPSYLVAAEAQGDASLDKEDSVAATIAADLLGRSRGSATKGGNLTPTRALLEHQEQQSLANSAAALAPSQFSAQEARSHDALLEGTAGGSSVGGVGGGGGSAGDAKATATVAAGVAGVDARGVLEGLSRSEVQARAKTHGIKANGKTSALIDAIFAKEQMKASAPASHFSASKSTKATKLHQGGAGDAGNEDAAVVTERLDAAKEVTSAVRLHVSIVFVFNHSLDHSMTYPIH